MGININGKERTIVLSISTIDIDVRHDKDLSIFRVLRGDDPFELRPALIEVLAAFNIAQAFLPHLVRRSRRRSCTATRATSVPCNQGGTRDQVGPCLAEAVQLVQPLQREDREVDLVQFAQEQERPADRALDAVT